jgi:imidazolonepropionase-like amidohydrolase
VTRTIFSGGDVFDGMGSAPARADVLVEDDRIIAVGTVLDGDVAVDCTGKTLLPGLFDTHVHVVVSDVGLRGRLQTPFSYQFYDAAVNLRKTLVLGAGADQLKVCTTGGVLSPGDDPRHSQFTPEELSVLVTEASMRGTYVMAHAQGTAGIKNAIRAGVRSIEHGVYLDDEAIGMMLDAGTWLVPTLTAPAQLQRAISVGADLPDAVVRKAKEVLDVHYESVRRAIAAGVKVAMGTDSGVGPHGSNLEELTLMAGCGMTPAQSLVAATSSAAGLLGLDAELGRLAPGYRADLVLVDGGIDDLGDLADRISAVWQDGREVRHRGHTSNPEGS